MHSYELEPDCWVCIDELVDGVRLANAVAVLIWRLHLEGSSPSEIVAYLVSHYDVSEQTALSDVSQTIHSLKSGPGISLKEPEPYRPDTTYMCTRPLFAVESETYTLPGYTIRLRTECAGLINYVNDMFSKQSTSDAFSVVIELDVFSNDGEFPIVYQGFTLDTGLTVADTAIKCLREVNGIIGRTIPDSIIFHASAVAKNRCAILFPATGGSGKTTLAAYLMTQGYEFLNDDAVPMCAENLFLHPVPLSLSIKKGAWSTLVRWFPNLFNARIYGASGHEIRYLPPVNTCVVPTPCRLIVIPQYDENCQQLESVALTTKEAFEHIITSGCILDQPIVPSQIEMLVSWLRTQRCHRLRYKNLDDAKMWLDSQKFDS